MTPPVLRLRTRYLVPVPIVIAATSIVLFSRILPAIIQTTSAECATTITQQLQPLSQMACFFSAFFRQCLTTPTAQAFMASLLALVSALVTISHVEAARVYNQPAKVITHPTLAWMVFNAATVAVVAPAILCANIRHHRVLQASATPPRAAAAAAHAAESTATSTTTGGGGGGGITISNGSDGGSNAAALSEETEPLLVAHDQGTTTTSTAAAPDSPAFRLPNTRHLISAQRSYSIPVAVLVGFVLPSALLLTHPSPLVAGLWNFFPPAVFGVQWSVLRGLGVDGINESSSSSPRHLHLPCVERDRDAMVRIYGLPVVLSVLAHVYLVAVVLRGLFRSSEGTTWSATMTPALELMVVDFCMSVLTYLYWLWIESSLVVVARAVLFACAAGPGAGICFGWVVKERGYAEYYI